MEDALKALLATSNPPTNYGLTAKDVAGIAACYDWDGRVDGSNWSRDTTYETIAEMITAEPGSFLADISRYYGDDYYLELDDAQDDEDEPETYCPEGGAPCPPLDCEDCTYHGEPKATPDEPENRVNWLCGCGNGGLAIPESEVPEHCGMCGSPIGDTTSQEDANEWNASFGNGEVL